LAISPKVGKLLDRGWPAYSNATEPEQPFMKDYIAFRRTPPLETAPRKEWPDENVFSISFRLSCGKFKFFNGGDLPGIRKNSPAWYDMETPVARVLGPVDAAILDHHGYLDAMNEFLVATLSVRVWTMSVWDSHHPTPGAWEPLQSERLYPGPRDVFAADVHPDARVAIEDIDRMASGHGHIALRCRPAAATVA
jgi:hypothetical protein